MRVLQEIEVMWAAENNITASRPNLSRKIRKQPMHVMGKQIPKYGVFKVAQKLTQKLATNPRTGPRAQSRREGKTHVRTPSRPSQSSGVENV